MRVFLVDEARIVECYGHLTRSDYLAGLLSDGVEVDWSMVAFGPGFRRLVALVI